MDDWSFIDADPSDQLARLHHFSMCKRQADGDVEFQIIVREHARPQKLGMHFYAEADKQTNQKTAPFTPCGWGQTLAEALSQCLIAIHRFPYEGESLQNDKG